jgi:uncharacterized protein
MAEESTTELKISKYLRTFQHEDETFIFHSCLGNPVKVNGYWDELTLLVEDGVCLAEVVDQPNLHLALEMLLEKGLLEYPTDPDLVSVGILENNAKIPTGEMIGLLVLDLHTACNMGCAYCYAAKTQAKHSIKGSKMPLDVALRSIDAFIDMSRANGKSVASVSYFGGEPLLNYSVLKQCMEQVTLFNSQSTTLKLTQAITTNGTLITPEVVEDLKNNGCYVAVSMDGLQAEHDSFRLMKNGGGTFSRVIQSIRLLVAAKVGLEIIVTVGPHNGAKLPEFLEYLSEIGVNRVSIKGQTYDDYDAETSKLISGQVREGLAHARRLKMLGKHGPGDLDYKRGCQGLGGLVCVEPSGDIYPCPEGSRIKIGTVDTFSEIPMSDGYRKIASRITGNIEQCRGCDVEGLCKAGCAGEAEHVNGDVFKIDSTKCDGIRATIKRNLAVYGRA